MQQRNGFVSVAVLLATMLLLTGCGGKDSDTKGTSGSDGSNVSLSGVAATGAAIGSANITLKDKLGATKTVVTGADGKYTADITGMTAPFLLKVPSGGAHLYSVATAGGTVNIHPFTDLIIRNWYMANNSDVDTDFSGSGALTLPPTATDIAVIESVVRNIMTTWLTQVGLDPATFNLLTSSFDANSAGFDKILDNAQVTIDATGQVTVVSTDPVTGITGTTISTNIADLATADTTKPSGPTGLTALAAGTSSIAVLWTASTDNVGVAGYTIYRAGAMIATSPYPVYSDTGLAANTQYCYQVEAYDGAGAGNISAARSSEACATTLAAPDTTAPTAPGSPVVTVVSATQADLTWTASPSEDGVMGYQVYRGGTKIGTVSATGFSDAGYTSGACYTVKAFDAAGNVSAASSQTCGGSSPAPTAAATVWKMTMNNGQVFDGNANMGENAYLTLILTPSGNTLSGTMGFQDTKGRSGISTVTGSLSGSAITIQFTDFDSTCASRAVMLSGAMSANSLDFSSWSAPAAGTCSEITFPITFTLATPVTNTASGTYTFLSSSSTLTLNTTTQTNSNNDGPILGIEGINVTVNATTMVFGGGRRYHDLDKK